MLGLVHSDVVGKLHPKSLGGGEYFVHFLDDHSRFSEVEVLKKKSEVFEKFQNYVLKAENQLEKRLKMFQSDQGGEYTRTSFQNYLNIKGIIHRFSVAKTPQQNSRSERRGKDLLNVSRCLMIRASLPLPFWGEAVKHANFLRNLCPSRGINGAMPYEIWFGRKLEKEDVEKLRVFGCLVWVLRKEPVSYTHLTLPTKRIV